MPDVPGFMMNMGDSPQEQEIMSSLKDDILRDEPEPVAPAEPAKPETPEAPATTPETPEAPVTPPAKPNEDVPVEDDDIDKMNAAKKPGIMNEDEPENPEKKEEPPAKPEEKPTEPEKQPEKPTEPAKPEEKQDLTKVVERASEAVVEAKNTPTEKQTELMKAVQLSQSVPLIFVDNFPQMKDFELEDGTFNVDGYMQSYTKSLIMGIQKSLAGGPLSASVFGILHNAMKEEQTELSKQESEAAVEKERTERATNIMNTLQTNYPRLKNDKDLEEAFDDMLGGVMQKRMARIQAGEKLEDMKYEDFEKILLRIIGEASKSKPPSTEIEDDGERAEKLKGGVTLNGGGNEQPVDPIDADIDAMMRVKSKSLF